MDNDFSFLDDNDDFFSGNSLFSFSNNQLSEEPSHNTFKTFTPFAQFKENNIGLDIKEEIQASATNTSKTIISPKKSVPQLLNDKTTEKQKLLNQFLRSAVEKNMPELIGGLVQMGADPNCTYDDNFKPLFLCAKHENLDCFEALYSNGARLDERITSGQTALHAAICAGNINMLKRMVTLAPNKFNITGTTEVSPKLTLNPLYVAILYDAVDVLDFIFSKSEILIIGKIISECFPLHFAVLHAKPKSMETLLKFVPVDHKSKSGDTPLMLLARRSSANNTPDIESRLDKIVDLLIQHNTDLDALSANGKNVFDIAKGNKKDNLVHKLALTAINKPIAPSKASMNRQPHFTPSKKPMSLK